MDLRQYIRTIPNFPKKGVRFRDLTPLLKNHEAMRYCIQELKNKFEKESVDVVVAAESRGFIFGALLAQELKAGFVPVRKPGKLPHTTVKQEFELEYGKDAFEMHEDAIAEGDNVLVVDDVLATGGTAKAAIDLVERLGGIVVGAAFVIELEYLNGRKKIQQYNVQSVIQYEKE